MSSLGPWHLSFAAGSVDDRRHEFVRRLLDLDRRYLLNQLSHEEYQQQIAGILAEFDE